ncbi:thiolase C-terminal domain-containing protein [Peijinzhouia sedimentorum]
MEKPVQIIGAYNTKFGKLEDQTLYSLYAEAAIGAIDDAGIEAKDIDGIFVGNYSGGAFNNQEHIAPFGVNILPELRHKPMYRTENACASGSSAVHMAIMAIQSGMMDTTLVIGVEKMNTLNTKDTTRALSMASYWPIEGNEQYTFPGLFAEYAKGWMAKFGYTETQLRNWLAQISAKAYTYAADNPLAHIQKARTAEEILALPDEKNPMIAYPLRLHDCSLISDGAAGIVISRECGLNLKSNVEIAGFYNASDYLDLVNGKRPNFLLEGAAFAVEKSLKMAGVKIKDIQVAEVHDCFTITELLIYSAMGLATSGREFEVLESGDVLLGGKCVINPSGGLKAKGHPVGATGVSMHALIYKQLLGEAIGKQVKNAEIGMTLNIGGSGASNMISVMRRIA